LRKIVAGPQSAIAVGKNAKLAGETTLVAGIAGRYATALFDLAREENQLDEMADALRGLQKLLTESRDFARLVASPVFSTAEQSAALAAISTQASIPQLAANFLQLLVRNRRLFILGDVISGYLKLLARHRNEVTADVTSAIALTDEQAEELKATLKAKTGRTITLNARVDPTILGGLIVKIGSRMVDSSVRTKLNNLKIAMKEVG
jgi:F-type H+-transporting ATPase subunit delta